MALKQGFRLGPYEILSPLGAGGMGEVYKAKDTRLDRYVAVKVLPEDFSKNPDALGRFEREAKAVAALNHPNITGIFDIGRTDDTVYAVMELLEGESLGTRLKQGALSPRVAIELASQMARGLAAAHDKGVIHRDLKPENFWVTRDGRLKILDFGLAKQVSFVGQGSQSHFDTQAVSPGHVVRTEEGMILGSVGYMSPEQVRGEAVDARSDIFSFGAVLFEMLTGRRAFARDTASDTLAAILRDDPPEVENTSGRIISMNLRRIVDHCLEKAPARRFHDAEDLAFALENFSTASDSSAPFSAPFAPQNRQTSRKWAAVAAGLLIAAGLGGWALRGGPHPPPAFQRLTFVPGTIESARFGPDGKTVYFSERVAGAKPELFVLDPRSPEPKALGIQDALLLGVSTTNELAFLRTPRLIAGFTYRGLLTQAPGGGGAQRELQEDIVEAAWDGAGLPKLGLDSHSQLRLEFPAGKLLLVCNANTRTLSHLSLSRDGSRMALVDGDYAKAATEIVVYDREGRRRVLFTKEGDGSGATISGLAWGPSGELWVSELQGDQTALWALSLKGDQRPLWRSQGALQLLDVSTEGRILLAQQHVRRGVLAKRIDEALPRDLSILGSTQAEGLSADGRQLLLVESPVMDGGTAQDRAYLRPLEGGPALTLGHGFPKSISADGRWVFMDTGAQEAKDLDPAWALAYQEAGLAPRDLGDPKARGRFILFVPAGLGRPFALALPKGFESTGNIAHLLPDGQRMVANLAMEGKEAWVLLDRRGGKPKILTHEGLGIAFASISPLSPDGTKFIVGNALEWFIQPLTGGEAQPIHGMRPGERLLGWSADGGAVFVRPELSVLPVTITRLDLKSSVRNQILAFTPPDPAGHIQTRGVFMTPDARAFAFTCEKQLSELYLVEGLK